MGSDLVDRPVGSRLDQHAADLAPFSQQPYAACAVIWGVLLAAACIAAIWLALTGG